MKFDPVGNKKLGHAEIECSHKSKYPKMEVHKLLKDGEGKNNMWCVAEMESAVTITLPPKTPSIGGIGFKSATILDTGDPLQVIIMAEEQGKWFNYGTHPLNWKHRRADTIKVDLIRPMTGKKICFVFKNNIPCIMVSQIRFDKAK